MKNETSKVTDAVEQTKSLHYYRPSDGRKKRQQQNPWIVTVGGKEVARFGDRQAAYAYLKSLRQPHDENHRNLLASLGADGWAWLDYLDGKKPKYHAALAVDEDNEHEED